MRRSRDAAGFTLLEVMAALSVFLIGVTSVLALLSTGTRLHQDSQATALAADAAEEVLLLAQRELAAAAAPAADGTLPEVAVPQPVPGQPGLSYRWSVRAAPEGGLYLLAVEVSWMQGGRVRTQQLEKVLPRLRSASADAKSLWLEQ